MRVRVRVRMGVKGSHLGWGVRGLGLAETLSTMAWKVKSLSLYIYIIPVYNYIPDYIPHLYIYNTGIIMTDLSGPSLPPPT